MEVKCHKCEHPNTVDFTEKKGAYFWNCDRCGEECGMTVSWPIEDLLTQEQLSEYEVKINTKCSLKVLYSELGDISKFKKFFPLLSTKSNLEISNELKRDGGIIIDNLSVFEAEGKIEELKSLGLLAEIIV